MVLGIRVKQPPNHALVLRVVLAGFRLEEVDAALAQGDGDFDALVTEDQFLRRR